jgi:hypothetical protein
MKRGKKAMKTGSNERNVVHMSPELLAEARCAADEERRPAEDLVSDAVRRYLQERRHAASEVFPTEATAIERARELNPNKKKPLSELFAALRGSDIDLGRNPSTGRPVNL